MCLAEGPRLLRELASSGPDPVQVLYTVEAEAEPRDQSLIESLLRRGVHCERVPEKELESLADAATPQGVLAAVPIPNTAWPDSATSVLVLDRVQDPGNVGTLLRTAEALGLDGVAVLRGTADPWGPKALRAAAGSTFRLPLRVGTWPEVGGQLSGDGFEIWVAEASGESLMRSEPMPEKLALVLGNEGEGVDSEILAAGVRKVAVSLVGGAESLNVAAAGAILMDRIFGG
ncbi:MAG: RNA methyltransferase [Gemmatimonadota bacterium]